MTGSILFSGNPMDRVDQARRDPDWIEAHLARDQTRYLPLWRLEVLVRGGGEVQKVERKRPRAARSEPARPGRAAGERSSGDPRFPR